MDLIFAVQGPPNDYNLPEKVLISTSSAGLVAFYTNCELRVFYFMSSSLIYSLNFQHKSQTMTNSGTLCT